MENFDALFELLDRIYSIRQARIENNIKATEEEYLFEHYLMAYCTALLKVWVKQAESLYNDKYRDPENDEPRQPPPGTTDGEAPKQ
jgi:hypothetical protein